MTPDHPKHRIQELKESIDFITGHVRQEGNTPIYDELRAQYDADTAMETLFPSLFKLRSGTSC